MRRVSRFAACFGVGMGGGLLLAVANMQCAVFLDLTEAVLAVERVHESIAADAGSTQVVECIEAIAFIAELRRCVRGGHAI